MTTHSSTLDGIRSTSIDLTFGASGHSTSVGTGTSGVSPGQYSSQHTTARSTSLVNIISSPALQPPTPSSPPDGQQQRRPPSSKIEFKSIDRQVVSPRVKGNESIEQQVTPPSNLISLGSKASPKSNEQPPPSQAAAKTIESKKNATSKKTSTYSPMMMAKFKSPASVIRKAKGDSPSEPPMEKLDANWRSISESEEVGKRVPPPMSDKYGYEKVTFKKRSSPMIKDHNRQRSPAKTPRGFVTTPPNTANRHSPWDDENEEESWDDSKKFFQLLPSRCRPNISRELGCTLTIVTLIMLGLFLLGLIAGFWITSHIFAKRLEEAIERGDRIRS